MNTLSAVQASLENQARECYERARIARRWAAGNMYRLEYKLFSGLWISQDMFFKNANELADWYHHMVDTKDSLFEFEQLWMWDGLKPVIVEDIFPHLRRIQ